MYFIDVEVPLIDRDAIDKYSKLAKEKAITSKLAKEKVLAILAELAEKKNITILYACEVGSRAWGYESQDSDYDVRFIYKSNEEDYYLSLNIENKSDTISNVSEEHDKLKCDLHGWDIRKFLKLVGSSNAAACNEWMRSPIVYIDVPEVRQLLTDAAASNYKKRATYYHYLNMAKRNYKKVGETTNDKELLNILRPLMTVKWLTSEQPMTENNKPSLDIDELWVYTTYDEDDITSRSIRDIIHSKRNSLAGKYPLSKYSIVDVYIENNLRDFAKTKHPQFKDVVDSNPVNLNAVFRHLIKYKA